MSERRIASVQHGDYAEALRLIGRGEPEPYFGMAYTLDVLRDLFGASPHLVVSLNSPPYRETIGAGELVGLPRASLPRPVPGSIAAALWGRQVVKELRRFEPTHVLLRSGGTMARHVLEFCTRRNLSTLVVFANRFDASEGLRGRMLTRRIVRMLNHPCVKIVGNHKQPATDSMLECGLDASKAVAWDWPGTRHPKDWPVKSLQADAEPRIVYVGSMSNAKGVGDLIDAVAVLAAEGRPVRLTALGDGADLAALRMRAAALPPGIAEFPGRVSNETAFRRMIEGSVVCVPSRHEFSEGMPLTLTEALASRTPAVISDHPVLVRAFAEGEGVRFFAEKDSRALARVLWEVLSDRAEYARLSAGTLDAFRRVECTTSFGDLVMRWRSTFT